MTVSRGVLLALSESSWLRANAPRWRIVRKAAARFMPGERFEDALAAAQMLHRQGFGTVLTRLGENVTSLRTADAVMRHYSDVLARAHEAGLDCDISVKLTQLGLDLDTEQCRGHLETLAAIAGRHEASVWLDMEQHAYLERTLMIYRQLLERFQNVGVCLQAYLRRTREDLRSLLPLGGGIRLVKGAYREPASIAFPAKRDVDANFLDLAACMLAAAAAPHAPRVVFGTHDRRMLNAIAGHAERVNLGRGAFEFHLLFGIQRAEQLRLARDGFRVRVLISYGDEWFAWYMRRLAERPANVLFAARAILARR